MNLATLIEHPSAQPVIAAAVLVFGALFATLVVRKLLLRGVERLLKNTDFGNDAELRRHKVIPRLANIVPAVFVIIGLDYAADLPADIISIIKNVTRSFIILTLAMSISSVIAIADTIYQRIPKSRLRPIKGYMQILRIMIYLVAAILIVSTLIDKSPVILLSGLGAMAAVLILVFQDTLLSLVASIQITLNDIVRVGDWIEMPDYNADGDVIEIALHTIKVQNWDKTITTIPIRSVVTHAFKNYRGMTESGGRRIKRSLNLDQNSIRFLEQDEISQLGKLRLLRGYLDGKVTEIDHWNLDFQGDKNHEGDRRRLTNIGTFRAYVEAYLQNHPKIRNDMTLLVRQLPSSSTGLPIEVYCFTNTTAWAEYEGIQSDLFDHLISIVPAFGLSVFQEPAGSDFKGIGLIK